MAFQIRSNPVGTVLELEQVASPDPLSRDKGLTRSRRLGWFTAPSAVSKRDLIGVRSELRTADAGDVWRPPARRRRPRSAATISRFQESRSEGKRASPWRQALN